MSVSLNPSNALGFKRPLTTLVKRSLTITNNNPQPVAFKVKTTAPKLYCVRPNSGRVEPGESVDVSVMLQALKEEPPLNTKCKDKFLIQSTIITPDKENLALHEIWASPEANEEGKVFQQKLRVTYLPAEGQTLEEEDENLPASQAPIPPPPGESRYETVHLPGPTNGHAFTTNLESHFAPAPSQETVHDARSQTPPHDEPAHDVSYEAPQHTVDQSFDLPNPVIREPTPEPQHEPSFEHEAAHEPTPETVHEAPPPPPVEPIATSAPEPAPVSAPAPAPAPVQTPAPAPEPIIITRENPINEEIFAKYNMAQAEIERLKAQINSITAQQELRRRTRKLSDADSTAASDFHTVVEDAHIQPEGVPLQVVVIIALGVFVTTYLFF